MIPTRILYSSDPPDALGVHVGGSGSSWYCHLTPRRHLTDLGPEREDKSKGLGFDVDEEGYVHCHPHS